MRVLQELNQSGRHLLLPVLLASAFASFIYQLVTGDRGVWVWYSLNEQVSTLEEQNTVLRKRVEMREKRVARLKSETMDLDYMDQLVRQDLGMIRSDERVIYLSSN